MSRRSTIIVLGLVGVLLLPLIVYLVQDSDGVIELIESHGGHVVVKDIFDPPIEVSPTLTTRGIGNPVLLSLGTIHDPVVIRAAATLSTVEVLSAPWEDAHPLTDEQLQTYLTARIRNGTQNKLLSLWYSGSEVTDDSMPLVGKIHSLTHLLLNETQITDEGVKALTGLHRLKVLALQGTAISDAGVECIANSSYAQSLTNLYLSDTKITEMSISQLKKLKNLQVLELDGVTISP